MAFGDLLGTFTVAQNSITNPTAASLVTGSGAVAVGDLVVAVLGEQTALTVTAVDDNLGNTYAAQNAGTDGGTITGRMFYSRVTNAGTISSISATCSASADNVAMVAAIFDGPFAVSPIDANPANNNNTDNASPFTCPATGTLAQADELVVAWMCGQSNATWLATSPNLKATQVVSQSVADTILGYQVVASTSTVSPEFTGTNPSASVQGTASFKKDLVALVNGIKDEIPLLVRPQLKRAALVATGLALTLVPPAILSFSPVAEATQTSLRKPPLATTAIFDPPVSAGPAPTRAIVSFVDVQYVPAEAAAEETPPFVASEIGVLVKRRPRGAAVLSIEEARPRLEAWKNDGWQVHSFQPPRRKPELKGATLARGDEGQQARFVNWQNDGWHVQSFQSPHERSEIKFAALIGGDVGNHARFQAWRNDGWAQTAALTRHPLLRASVQVVGDHGIAAPFVPPPAPITWAYELPQALVRIHSGVMPNAGDDGTQASFIVWQFVGWANEPHETVPSIRKRHSFPTDLFAPFVPFSIIVGEPTIPSQTTRPRHGGSPALARVGDAGAVERIATASANQRQGDGAARRRPRTGPSEPRE